MQLDYFRNVWSIQFQRLFPISSVYPAADFFSPTVSCCLWYPVNRQPVIYEDICLEIPVRFDVGCGSSAIFSPVQQNCFGVRIRDSDFDVG